MFRKLLALVFAIAYVPLSRLFYWLPYRVRGLQKYAFYEAGGYFIDHYVTVGIGILAALLFLGWVMGKCWRTVVVPFCVIAGVMCAGYMVFGLTDRVPDYGE